MVDSNLVIFLWASFCSSFWRDFSRFLDLKYEVVVLRFCIPRTALTDNCPPNGVFFLRFLLSFHGETSSGLNCFLLNSQHWSTSGILWSRTRVSNYYFCTIPGINLHFQCLIFAEFIKNDYLNLDKVYQMLNCVRNSVKFVCSKNQND